MWLRMRSLQIDFVRRFGSFAKSHREGCGSVCTTTKTTTQQQEPRCKNALCCHWNWKWKRRRPHTAHTMDDCEGGALANSTAPGCSKLQLPCCLRPAPSSQSIFRTRLLPLLTPLRLLKAIGIMLLFKRKQNGVLSNS